MNKPLSNKTIVITRSMEQSGSSINIFGELGANVILFPTIKIVDPKSFELFDSAITNVDEFDYLIFTSVNAVNKFSERITELRAEINFEKLKIVVAGTKTAEACNEKKIKVDVIPDKFSAEGIIENLRDQVKNKKVLIPCSMIARKELSEGLISIGAIVTKVPVYDVTIPNDEENKSYVDELNNSNPDLFIFTSPSTFENFLIIMKIENPKNYFRNFLIAVIGTTTEKTINNYSVNVEIVPSEFTMEALANEITNYYKKINLTIES